MKNNSSVFLFHIFMFLGILISVSSNNWLSCWLGIEINLISFLPIMTDSSSIYSSESMISYFIIQSMGSSLLFLSIILLDGYFVFIEYLIVFSLMIKIGCPPFHMWFPSVMEGLSWKNCFILSTVQKFTPMVLISYMSMSFVMVFIIMACIWGSIGGLSYSSLRKIIAYSSIYNLGWIISGINMFMHSWFIYFLIYSSTLFMLCYLFNLNNLNYLNQFFLIYNNFYGWLIMMVLFMSMGGLPPFLGFIPSMFMIYSLVNGEFYMMCMFLLMSALVVLFFYLRVVFTGLMINSLSLKFNFTDQTMMVYLFGMITMFGIFILFLLKLYL
uniref:NADH-ubiquinone oxidoreductase chain 2 n=1 Tax=Tettigades auropilosa TaxID=1498843 RepID=A0A3Q8G7C8_9HEMI|nr:NADH dehydrogenase subunit 2 [Tettigades auropilosa]AWV83822.1 NADH dehydrogenase subunit 2 [Tettigades auropilosa]AWV83835.1 NADH dehydrogenase subunit 2 [Tettigades auropilosa]